MSFADIHIHALYGVDDGAATRTDMERIVADAYADGTRILCLTPHFHLGYFGDNHEKTELAFQMLRLHAAEKYPELLLYLGNELRYSRDCISWLTDGLCRTLNDTDYVLVDFSETESTRKIVGGLDRLLNAGYTPILAHAERYRDLHGDRQILSELRANGVILQVDSQSLLGGFGLRVRMQARTMLRNCQVDLVSSDAHDTSRRPPQMSRAYRYIAGKCGDEYAHEVCYNHAVALLQNTY